MKTMTCKDLGWGEMAASDLGYGVDKATKRRFAELPED